MCRLFFFYLLLACCFGCKKVPFEPNPRYSNTKITATQHKRALSYAATWPGEASVNILDTVFQFKHVSQDTLDQYVYYTYLDNQLNKEVEVEYTATWDYIDRKMLSQLRSVFWFLIQEDQNKWRPLLSVQLDVTVHRYNQKDTVVHYYKPFSDPFFNY